MSSYTERRTWADRFDPMIHALVRPYLGDLVQLVNAEDIDDMHHATDAVANGRIALAKRVRATDYRDITIRSRVVTGGPTEADKLPCSPVHRYFYGWVATHDSMCFDDWMLFDIRRFVDAGFLAVWREIPNHDQSWFKAGPAMDLWHVPKCVIASSDGLEPPSAIRLFP